MNDTIRDIILMLAVLVAGVLVGLRLGVLADSSAAAGRPDPGCEEDEALVVVPGRDQGLTWECVNVEEFVAAEVAG